MATPSPTSFAASGARLEEVLEALASRVAGVERGVVEVRGEVRGCVTRGELEGVVGGLERRIAAVEQRVTALERSVRVEGVAEQNVGQCVASLLQSTLPALRRQLDAKAPSSALDSLSATLLRRLDDLDNKAKAAKKASDTAKAVERALQALRDRCGLLEDQLRLKVDRDALSGLESAAAVVREEMDGRVKLEHDVGALGAAVAAQARALEREVERGEVVGRVVERVVGEVGRKAGREEVDRAVEALEEKVREERRRREHKEAAAKEAVELVQGRVEGVEAGVETVRERIAALEEWKPRVQEEIAKRPTTEQVTLQPRGTRMEAAIRALSREIAQKTPAHAHAALHARCKGTEDRIEAIQEQAAVALEFVQWFSKRGEGYEHNAAAIERAMHRLAAGNVAAVATPTHEP